MQQYMPEEAAQTGLGRERGFGAYRIWKAKLFHSTENKFSEASNESCAAPQQRVKERRESSSATWTSSADSSPRIQHLELYSHVWRQPETCVTHVKQVDCNLLLTKSVAQLGHTMLGSALCNHFYWFMITLYSPKLLPKSRNTKESPIKPIVYPDDLNDLSNIL